MKINKDSFSRLFVLAKLNKVNLLSFSTMLMKYDDLMLGKEDDVASLVGLFNDITGLYVQDDGSYGIYDDAYWCGTAYFYLFKKTGKPLPYILLKMPFDRLMEMYGVYHEMDYSSVLERFNEIEKEKTILRILCQRERISVPQLSKRLAISVGVLKKYNAEDECLYAASFQKIYRIQKFFGVPFSLFAESN
jgi:hypothetical protein